MTQDIYIIGYIIEFLSPNIEINFDNCPRYKNKTDIRELKRQFDNGHSKSLKI